jgi:hypothetical protein
MGTAPGITVETTRSARRESSCASFPTLGPRWVRVTTVEHGHGRSPTVAHGSEEPQVTGPSTQAAGTTQTRGSDCGPEGRWEEARTLPLRIAGSREPTYFC